MEEGNETLFVCDSPTETWRECPRCGLFSVLPDMRPGLVAECPRCHYTLWRMRKVPFEFSLACGLAGLLFYLFALMAPFLNISVYGRFQLAYLATGPWRLSLQNYADVGLLVLAVTTLFPGLKLGIMLVTLIGLETRSVRPRWLKTIFRFHEAIAPWAMIDVYLLGFLVAYTRLTAIAVVHLETALYLLIGLMVSMAAADAALDKEAVWRALDEADSKPGAPTQAALAGGHAAFAYVGCLACGMVNHALPDTRCHRCHSILHRRKPHSVGRSWALLIAAALLYMPANLYPVMQITQLAAVHPFTIMAGITELQSYGLWPLALLVFFASICIPLAKLLSLAYMLIQTQISSRRFIAGRTRAFTIIEFIGRWSMIDVFMISILAALVNFGQIAYVHAELGAPCFAAVVILTMFAVSVFDPRLMWDAATPRSERELEPE
ncbi:MAG TPA: paraquat-inducible protein A [Acidocella sp.]|uniref:paraquat-inducible protein A n=1 Tax=Acidocella sp. TaxID=50710 RepID=UPI002BA092E2|nr:paraquat-inducible protein A [Acidocella sp.]HVE22383.1 paraquat-inducible protein A [Acidocella sp.]